MRLYRYLPVLVAVLLALYALYGCTSGDQYRAAAYSLELQYGVGDGNQDRVGKRSWDEDSSWFALGIHPFRWHEMVLQAQIAQRMATEAAYAARPEPQKPDEPTPEQVPQPCGKPK